MTKKKIIFFSDWFEPGYKAGGPIRSVSNMVKVLSQFHEIYVVTRITDFQSSTPYQNIDAKSWIQKDWGKVIYLRESDLDKTVFSNLIEEIRPDVIHLNSFFSPKFTLLPIQIAKKKQIKVVLAPRGMLGKGALQIKSAKKKAFIAWAKLKGVYKGITWHASTEMESDEIKVVFGNATNVKTALNLVHLDIASLENIAQNRVEETFKFVFISRISSKKNLLFALEFIKELNPNKTVIFDIYGPIEDEEYWKQCQNLMNEITAVEINYKGEIAHHQVAETFQNYDCLVLPTQHENFGHVFMEAWANGCTTLISDQTPWQDLQTKGVGASLSLNDKDAFIDFANLLLSKSIEERLEMTKKSLEFAREIVNNEENIKRNLNLFADEQG